MEDTGPSFTISFKLSPINGSGLYTIVIYANNTLPYKHPYDPSRYSSELPILEYTVYLSG